MKYSIRIHGIPYMRFQELEITITSRMVWSNVMVDDRYFHIKQIEFQFPHEEQQFKNLIDIYHII